MYENMQHKQIRKNKILILYYFDYILKQWN